MRNGTTFVARVASLGLPMAVFVSAVFVLFGVASLADEATEGSPNINGVWTLHARISDDGEVNELVGEEAEALIVKFISSGRWCVTYADPNTGSVRFHHGGTYTLKGKEYSEHIKYANESTRGLVNNALTFNVKVDADTLTQKGVGNPYSEVWKRVKK